MMITYSDRIRLSSEFGGVRAALELPPNREIDFDCACVCVACVRASERSCVREMIPLWLGSGGRIRGYPSVPPSGRRSRSKVGAF